MTKHTPGPMAWSGRFPRKSVPTATFKNGKNIWFNCYECGVCGKRHRIHVNFTPHGKQPWCSGGKRVKWAAIAKAEGRQ